MATFFIIEPHSVRKGSSKFYLDNPWVVPMARAEAVNRTQTFVANKRIVACKDTLQLRIQLDKFAEKIPENRPIAFSSEMGLRNIRIIEALYCSAKQSGARVEIKVCEEKLAITPPQPNSERCVT